MEQENKETNVKATIDAVTGLVTAIPVYQDTLQPAAKEIGKSLQVVAKTVNIALAPIQVLVWGYDKIAEFVSTRVSEKLKNIPEENIITPKPEVAGPAIEALRYAGHDDNLRELFANLLANAMDKETATQTHPGFVEILKNISSDEAILLQAFIEGPGFPLIDVNASSIDNTGYFNLHTNHSHLSKIVNVSIPDLIPAYLDNLVRLGILEIPSGIFFNNADFYLPLENDEELNLNREFFLNQFKSNITFTRKQVRKTAFGKQFIQNVVVNR